MSERARDVIVTQHDPVVFDMDGVILKGRGTDPAVYADAGDEALDSLGVVPPDGLRSVFRAHQCGEELEGACDELGIDIAEFWSLKERVASRLSHERIKNGPRGVHEDTGVLGELAESWTLGLVSNNRQETVEFVTEHFNFDGVFSVARGRDPTVNGFARRKPDPYYLTEILQQLECESGVYVGDREKDCIAATRAGMAFVHIDRPSFETRDHPTDAVATISTLAELPRVLSELSSP